MIPQIIQPDTSAAKQFRIGITDYVTPPADLEHKAFPEAEFVFLRDWRIDPAHRPGWQTVDAILVWHWRVDRPTLDLMPRCKIVVRYGVGYDAIDVPLLNERNMPFCNTPDYGTEEVADTACAMILAIQRKMVQYDRLCRGYRQTWQENLLKPHLRTSQQTLGLVGVGRIGTAVVNRMKPFGYRILGYDPYQPSGHEKAVGYERMDSMEQLLAKSDIVSIHCPLSDETRGLIDDRFFERMKPGASLVNTARGAILKNPDVLERALRSGRLASAALDVLPNEPPQDHPLLDAWRADADWLNGRLIINPHAAYYSEQGWVEMRYKAAQTARLFLIDGKLRNQITK
jgi:lactate dehydrogenase-like 2-hydroxyacid dehydrogenase